MVYYGAGIGNGTGTVTVKSRNRNHNFSLVGTGTGTITFSKVGTVKNSYGSTTLQKSMQIHAIRVHNTATRNHLYDSLVAGEKPYSCGSCARAFASCSGKEYIKILLNFDFLILSTLHFLVLRNRNRNSRTRNFLP